MCVGAIATFVIFCCVADMTFEKYTTPSQIPDIFDVSNFKWLDLGGFLSFLLHYHQLVTKLEASHEN